MFDANLDVKKRIPLFSSNEARTILGSPQGNAIFLEVGRGELCHSASAFMNPCLVRLAIPGHQIADSIPVPYFQLSRLSSDGKHLYGVTTKHVLVLDIETQTTTAIALPGADDPSVFTDFVPFELLVPRSGHVIWLLSSALFSGTEEDGPDGTRFQILGIDLKTGMAQSPIVLPTFGAEEPSPQAVLLSDGLLALAFLDFTPGRSTLSAVDLVTGQLTDPPTSLRSFIRAMVPSSDGTRLFAEVSSFENQPRRLAVVTLDARPSQRFTELGEVSLGTGPFLVGDFRRVGDRDQVLLLYQPFTVPIRLRPSRLASHIVSIDTSSGTILRDHAISGVAGQLATSKGCDNELACYCTEDTACADDDGCTRDQCELIAGCKNPPVGCFERATCRLQLRPPLPIDATPRAATGGKCSRVNTRIASIHVQVDTALGAARSDWIQGSRARAKRHLHHAAKLATRAARIAITPLIRNDISITHSGLEGCLAPLVERQAELIDSIGEIQHDPDACIRDEH